MKPLRVLLADDEPLIRTGLRRSLSRIPDVEVVGECSDGTDVIRRLGTEQVDLLLLDIRMPGSTGLDIVRSIEADRIPLIIFVTAFDEYAVQAFELNAVDYLLKPFDDDRLASAIARARERLGSFDSSRLVECLNSLIKQATPSNGSSTTWLKRLAVHGRLGYEMVPVETIDWISAADNYVELHCGESTHLLTETMSSLEQRLNPVEFARVHRGRIVNVSRITAIAPTLNGSYELRLRSGTRLSTGRQYKNVILKIIGKTEAS